MISVTKYRAADGTEFETADACQQYEQRAATIRQLVSRLKAVPTTNDFANGHGCVQQEPGTVLAAQAGIAQILAAKLGDFCSQHTSFAINATKPVGHTFIGRLIDDNGDKAIQEGWYRIMCIDQQFREWGQPYFARNPEMGQSSPV